jgi:GNAT superfamily N-acetyltransferase
MNIKFRNNCSISNFGKDFHKIRDFLLQTDSRSYSYGRWDFMTTHAHMDLSGIGNIAVWENNDEIVALATFDCFDGESSSCFHVKEGYGFLKKEMLAYVKDFFRKYENYTISIENTDTEFHDVACSMGFVPMENGVEQQLIFPIRPELLHYSLPEGFRVSSLAEMYDFEKYKSMFLKTFDELNSSIFENFSQDDYELELKSPYANLDLKIVVVAPNGDYAAYCGMWYDKKSTFAQVEPVGTNADYRNLGLGKAAVLEGIKRCGILGAKSALVDTDLQFYYNIGFRPYATSTGWSIKKYDKKMKEMPAAN